MPEPDVQRVLENATERLGETIELFAATRSVSDGCRQETNPALFSHVNSNHFWRTAYAAFQIAVFIGIGALVDKREDSSSFHTAARLLDEQGPGCVPKFVYQNLEAIRERYKVFRDKVFAHNDHDRGDLAERFEHVGFTWNSIQADIHELEYVQTVLWAVYLGRTVPSRADASAHLNIHHLRAAKIKTDAAALLRLIEKGLS